MSNTNGSIAIAHRDALRLLRAHLVRDPKATAAVLSDERFKIDPDATTRLIVSLIHHGAEAMIVAGTATHQNPLDLLDLALSEIDLATDTHEGE